MTRFLGFVVVLLVAHQNINLSMTAADALTELQTLDSFHASLEGAINNFPIIIQRRGIKTNKTKE